MTACGVDVPWFGDETDASTQVAPAAELATPDGAPWDLTCDVLVVGCGLSGCATVLRTAEDPALQVMAIDRGEGGGASALSGGVLYLGGTRVQRECGIEDSAENMAAYLAYETGSLIRPETLKRFTEQSATMIPWLEGHGARFGGPATDEKTSYPGTSFLYYSGNERTVAARKLAAPAPRGHRALPLDGKSVWAMSGAQLVPPLLASLKARPNVRFSPQTSARRLFVDAGGTVVGAEIWRIEPGSVAALAHRTLMRLGRNMIATILGVTAPAMRAAARIERASAKPVRVRARRGVVLSAGGFVYNRTMMARCAPNYVGMAPLGTVGDDGSGIKLGASVGGATDRMAVCSAWRFLYPPASWTKGIAVGPDGSRIVNEEEYGSRTGEALFERNGGRGWVIGDQPLHDAVVAETKSPELQPYQRMQLRPIMKFGVKSAPTLASLAAQIGVPAAALEHTVAAYNASIAAGEGDAFGKSDECRVPIASGPFHAYDISFDARLNPIPGLTMGGLTVDEDTGEVLDEARKPIGGLYAAGRTAVGICSNWYVSGLSLADCMFSGWRAADALRQASAATAQPAAAA